MPKALPQLAFSYPRRGLTGTFCTFRLGVGAAVRECRPDKIVELVDARTKKVLGRAVVLMAIIGKLDRMAVEHSHMAHNWKGYPDAERPALLKASMAKRYPPGRVTDSSVVTVIYLQEVPNEAV